MDHAPSEPSQPPASPPAPAAVRTRSAIALASDVGNAEAVAWALAALGRDGVPDSAVVLMPPPPAPVSMRQVARALGDATRDAVRPPGAFDGALRPGQTWRAVPLGQGSRRFDRVLAPAALLDRPRVLLAPLPDRSGDPTPLAILAGFAHPRQRMAVRFGDGAAVAELAAPLRPALVLLVAGDGTVLATADLVAAELAARAATASADGPVPWQQPAVQRAIDLDLGVRAVPDLDLFAVGGRAEALARRLRPQLGLPPSGERAGTP